MRVSIIICTRNRADSLRDTLASIVRSSIPRGMKAELLVLDNGSTDHTAQVVAATEPGCFTLRHIVEERTGQCYARNRGLDEMKGEVALFTDDDVRVPKDWIEQMCRPILTGQADAVAGGVFLPAHLAKHVGQCACWFASTDGIDRQRPRQMVGANMAFGRHVRDKVRSFDTELGPGKLGFGDDTLFCLQLIEAGYRVIGVFDAVVEHHFDSTRLTRQSFLDIAKRMGRSEAYLSYHWRHSEGSRAAWTAIRAAARLLYWRVSRWREWLKCDRVLSWELQLIEDRAHHWASLMERRRPRHYQKHGLVKLSVRDLSPHASSSSAESASTELASSPN